MAKRPNKIIEIIEMIKLKLERKYLEFGIFILISSFFWVLNALSKDYVTTISVPVRYANMPEDKQLTNELPNSIDLEVEGHGFDLLKQKIGIHIFPLKIDVRKNMESVNITGNQHRFSIVSKKIQSKIEANLDAQFRINKIIQDSIILIFSPIRIKKVAIKPQIKIEFSPQHQLQGKLLITPDSINISGPQAILDSISFVYTEALEIKNLNSSTQRNLKLIEPPRIELKTKRTVIGITVERFTEHSLLVPVKLVNESYFKRVALLQKKVSVKFIVGLSDFNSINPDDFLVTATLKKTDSIPEKLKTVLEVYPSSVSILSVTPKNVDYLIQKK